MKRILTLVAFFATLQASAQQVNPVPDYVFRNQMSVGRNAVTDTAAYFSIGPRYGATKGFMPPIVGDTATFSSGKRNGLLIFSVQKNKFLYWDSVRVQWSDMAGSSGSYITGKGITGYVPQYTDTATLDTSALYTLGNQLGIGTSSFVYSGSGRTVVELNGTAGGLYGFKRNDSAKGYLFHNGDNMELANTVAGSISFNTNSATRGSISSAGVWRLHNLAGTGDRVVVASSNGTLSASTSVTGLVDTTTISTRAWRQKGIDSVVSLIPAAGVGGSGTTNYVPKFTAGSTIGNSQIQDNGSGVGIGVNPDSSLKLYVRPNSTTGTAIYSDNGANSGFVVKYNGAITNIGNDFNAPLALFTNNTERLRIFANGRVFIGASPTDAGYQLDINGTLRSVNGANFATTSGNVGIGTASPAYKFHTLTSDATIAAFRNSGAANGQILIGNTAGDLSIRTLSTGDSYIFSDAGKYLDFGSNASFRMRLTSDGELLVSTTSDAGDYKLQVVGNARIGTGKLDIASNTTFGIGVARSGTSEVAGQIYNSNGILYLGAESSAGGQIFSGSSAYAAVIGSGANYPLQFATNNATRATINTNGELLINTTTDQGDYKLQVNGSVYNTGQYTKGAINLNGNGTSAFLFIDSATDVSPLYAIQYVNSNKIDPFLGGVTYWNTTGNINAVDIFVQHTASGSNSNFMQIGDGTNNFKVTKDASIMTANPTGGTAKKWRLGSAATVSPTSPNRTIEVEVDGVIYYLHAKTTND